MATEQFSEQLDELYGQLLKKVNKYKTLDEKDIRIKHLQILASEVLFGLYSLKINIDFSEKLSKDFANIFDNDEKQIENMQIGITTTSIIICLGHLFFKASYFSEFIIQF